MNIQKLKLSHYRNFEKASFSFEPGCVHVFRGRNAQGKTNLLEAMYFLCHLRSWRTSKTPALIEHGQDHFLLECTVENKGRMERLRTVFSHGKKYLFRNEKPVATFSSFVGILNAVLFSPSDLTLFSDPPKERRKLMDMELVKLSHSYTDTLSTFQKLLRQRSEILKTRRPDEILLDTITEQMIDAQAVLIRQRSAFVTRLEEKIQAIFPGFSQGDEQLTLRYKTCVDSLDSIESSLRAQYEKSRTRDLQMKTTSIGVHRDDLEFYLNDRLVTQTASQGQRRSIMLSLKIALCQVIEETTSQTPVLLLDDVFSELDPLRRARLIEAFPRQTQIFITTSEEVRPEWFCRPVRFYTVSHGEMKEGIFDV